MPDDGELSRERVDRDHLDHVDRRYLYGSANLIRLLGLEGDKVVQIAADGDLFYITTREKRMS